MKRIFKLLSIIALTTIISCNSEKRENPPNDDILNNNAYMHLIKYDYENNKLNIKAETNFPEETKVKVNIFGYVNSTKEENNTDTYGKTVVEDGKINIKLEPWNVPQEVEFLITLDEQNKKISNFFSKNGENLKIDNKNKHGISPSIALFIEKVEINKELISNLKKEKPKELKFTQPSKLKHPAEKTLANFVTCMKDKNWSKMTKYSQKSQNETSKTLNNMFSSISSVDGFEIIERNEKNSNFNEIKYKLYIQTGIKHKGIQERIITANVIKENGTWGVNATSAMGGLYN
ncbi:hypothetical protein G1L01_11415 [Tenacibaculum finnmarkense]|uniref:hypothetical protein n=1 Tax=Tenacibaculum finnmarkense TaxID=2781243 RepID=UPI001EFAC50F|nr:hypothetical protein [Tenacibaculum finnmarkense]MCG8203227.1 hypothetical protein [Tenacibaculum finnmarkense genomovar finnmarkense]MCG8881069.1 hypothetical protein [Tenacibaculum finnmarkense]MCM8865982.1 hypothetical protein [Tenacibaculum finnmarkense genomovar finnmarkense]MCM8888127.1 hypothetical protein [Tenacibaculum finnmarkense genomovar finnmarkense]MCM8896619.1 hypothetical protein [Tenacibaculum finnmarkense genomovar finnmarkense]